MAEGRQVSDPVLAEMMKGQRAPVEKIERVDIPATILNAFTDGRRVVQLACGHRIVTKNKKRARCPECHRMILSGEDYDYFRHGGTPSE